MKKRILSLVLLSIVFFKLGYSQYIGPTSISEISTVEFVKKNAAQLDKTDTLIKLKGKIVEKINKDNFWFEDETGKILIEIETKHFPMEPIDENTMILITGDVDYDLLEEVEVEVETIQILK